MKTPRLVLALFVLATALPARASACEDPLLQDFYGADFQRVNRVAAVSAALGPGLGNLIGREAALADPAHLAPAGAPARAAEYRLVFAGRSGRVWFIHYAQGDADPIYHLVILSPRSSGRAAQTRHFVSTGRAWSVPGLKNMVRRGDFKPVAYANGG